MASSTTSFRSSPRLTAPHVAVLLHSHSNPTALSFPVNSRSRPLTNLTLKSPSPPLPVMVLCSLESRAAEVSKNSWEKSILKSDVPVLVEFYASWCGPCRMVHRVIDEIAKDYHGRLKCFILNTDTDLQIAEDYEIKAIPVVLLFKNGEKRESVVGTMPKEFYVAAIERVLQS